MSAYVSVKQGDAMDDFEKLGQFYHIIHRPLSDLFVVYNERRNSVSGDLIDRAVILKLTYMFAR
jgi:hypothetical protein